MKRIVMETDDGTIITIWGEWTFWLYPDGRETIIALSECNFDAHGGENKK